MALLGEADVEEPPLAGALFNATEEAAAELDGGDGRGVGVKLVRASKEESGDFVVDDVECATVRSERGDGAAEAVADELLGRGGAIAVGLRDQEVAFGDGDEERAERGVRGEGALAVHGTVCQFEF